MTGAMTFKQLVKQLWYINGSEEGFHGMCADIDKSFEREKITWEDHEMLYDMACWIYKGKKAGDYARII